MKNLSKLLKTFRFGVSMGKQEFVQLTQQFSKIELPISQGSEKDFLNCNEIEGGIGARCNYSKYREGSDLSAFQRNIPGICEVENIKFKKGITKDSTFMYNWFFASCVKGLDLKINVLNIELYGDDGKTKCVNWEVYNVRPVSYKGPSLNAAESKIAFEEIEVCHEGIARLLDSSAWGM